MGTELKLSRDYRRLYSAAAFADLPVSGIREGDTGHAQDTNIIYRWDPALLTWTPVTLYFGAGDYFLDCPLAADVPVASRFAHLWPGAGEGVTELINWPAIGWLAFRYQYRGDIEVYNAVSPGVANTWEVVTIPISPVDVSVTHLMELSIDLEIQITGTANCSVRTRPYNTTRHSGSLASDKSANLSYHNGNGTHVHKMTTIDHQIQVAVDQVSRNMRIVVTSIS